MFAERLKNLRADKDLSQEELSKIIGVKQQTIGGWETGRTEPDHQITCKLAEFFDVSTDYLLGLSNERKPGAGVKAIDDPEVTDFMKTVVGEFRLDPNITDKDRQDIIDDLAEYFRFKLQQKKQQRKNY